MTTAGGPADESLQLALEAGRIGHWEWEIPTGRVRWSPTLEAIHGLPTGGFPGTIEASQRDVHPQDMTRVQRAIQETITDRRDLSLEYRIILPDATTRWVEALGKLVRDGEGRPVTMSGVCRDVTDRKTIELERAQLLDELQRIGQLRERFLGIVAHDLRNPLNAISIWAHNLIMSENAPEECIVGATRIVQSTMRMSRMIGELLDFTDSRLAGGLPIHVSEVDMGEVGRQVLEELRPVKPEREILYETDGNLRGRWDANRVAQVFSNLVGNMLQHGAGPVSVGLRRQGDDVTLEISGRGHTIPKEMISTFFEPFSRTERPADGLGLGMHLVREIVRAHGGSIDLTSTAEGTTFLVLWPAA